MKKRYILGSTVEQWNIEITGKGETSLWSLRPKQNRVYSIAGGKGRFINWIVDKKNKKARKYIIFLQILSVKYFLSLFLTILKDMATLQCVVPFKNQANSTLSIWYNCRLSEAGAFFQHFSNWPPIGAQTFCVHEFKLFL